MTDKPRDFALQAFRSFQLHVAGLRPASAFQLLLCGLDLYIGKALNSAHTALRLIAHASSTCTIDVGYQWSEHACGENFHSFFKLLEWDY